MSRVLFLHGLHGSPQGRKVQLLRSAGHEVLAPSLVKESIAPALSAAHESVQTFQPDVIVGSSRGGALALSLPRSASAQMVLIAPAWVLYSPQPHLKPGTVILHSIHDAVIPFGESELLVKHFGASASVLRAVGVDHSMNDPAAADALLNEVGMK